MDRTAPPSFSSVLWRWLRFGALALLALVACAAGLFAYFLYTPAPALPSQSGTLSRGVIEVGGLKRSYQAYLPRGLKPGAALVLVMHGSGEGASEVRTGTGYGFERLADQHGFAVVYPESHTFDWNDCSVIGNYKVAGTAVDDIGFLGALVDKLVAETGAASSRVFAAGVSAGGSMALRLALEAPQRYRAVAAVAASVPTPDNFKCHLPAARSPASIMMMSGTADPLVPFNGGEINLLGMFYKAGTVRPAREAAQYLASLATLGAMGQPRTRSSTSDGVRVEQLSWQGGQGLTELLVIHGGGHGLPQPWSRRPRLLGPSPMAPDGPAMIWSFFERAAKLASVR